ncbi:MAG: hypothetical protein A2Z99_03855 [Treponema sp. GWB1_62_6]|nr:MAG: hypothetical protein A2Z99_03855 [Treponema sp. GWB1_62_6]OHE64867.1 MAG: hypothetical protein A2001_16245 [Treponema sp. GWC1_61_84]
MRAHWEKLVADADRRTGYFMAIQNADPASADFGSTGMDFKYPDPKPTLFFASNAVSAYLNPDSAYCGDTVVLDAVERALSYAERVQNPDGTFDFRPCNFRSAPDTAFIVNRIVTTRDLITASGDAAAASGGAAAPAAASGSALRRIASRLDAIIVAAGPGMAALGFHTPNHRWALAAALSSCARISGEDRFRQAAERYLAEGIDGNEDGEYAERSAGNYNMVNNDQMIILSGELSDASFLEYVRRNLSMMLAYVDPDGSVFTNNSTRQDRGKKVYLDQYFFNYLYAGSKLGDAALTAAARRIMDDIIAAGREAPDCLDRLMLEFGRLDYGGIDAAGAGAGAAAGAAGAGAAGAALPAETERFYRESGIVRVRRGKSGFSLLRDAGRFLYVSSGAVTAYLKIGVSYFDKREARPTTIEREGDAYVLRAKLAGWYYQPFGKNPGTSDWWKMDNASRGLVPGPDLDFTITARETLGRDGVELRLRAEGWKGVPVRFEIGVPADSWVESEYFATAATAGGAVLAKAGHARARIGADVLEIGPCFAEHRDIGGTYGSEGRSPDHFTIYCADFSPFDRILTMRRVGANGV